MKTDENLDIPDNSRYKLTGRERLALGLHSNDGVVNGRFSNTMFSCRRCRAEIRRIRNEEKELHSRKLQPTTVVGVVGIALALARWTVLFVNIRMSVRHGRIS